MNFTPFSGQFQSAAAAAMPTIHQFAAKFGYEGGGGGQEARYGGVQLVDGVRFRPDGLVVVSAAQPAVALAPIGPIHTVNAGVKYQTISASSSVNVGNIAYGGQTSYIQESVHLKEREKREYRDDHHHDIMASMMHQHQTPIQQGTQQLLVVLHEPKEAAALARVIKQEVRPDRATNTVPAEFISIGDVSDTSTWQTLGGGVADYLSTLPLPLHHLLKYSTPSNVIEKREEPTIVAAVSSNALPPMSSLAIQPNSAAHSVLVQTTTIVNQNVSTSPPLPNAITYPNNSSSHNINNSPHSNNTNSNSTNNSHIVSNNSHIVSNNSHIVSNNSHIVSNNSHIVANNSHIVSNNSHTINNNSNIVNNNTNVIVNLNNSVINNNTNIIINNKRRKKKKANKEKLQRPKPGEIRLTTALDGSTLYCCPECHMAYPERGLLEQHLLGHTMERRYICDICNAALKRKDHLTRHKQSHNPERPHVCSVCLKAFKRKEQLTLHFVIHSGEKRHVCNECGKGFYRKDHLRKHSRSHIARRVKAELIQHQTPAPLPSSHSPDVS